MFIAERDRIERGGEWVSQLKEETSADAAALLLLRVLVCAYCVCFGCLLIILLVAGCLNVLGG